MSVQSSFSAQPPGNDVSKIRSPESVSSLVRKLKGTRSRCGAGRSKYKTLWFMLQFIGVVCIVLLLFVDCYNSTVVKRGRDEKN